MTEIKGLAHTLETLRKLGADPTLAKVEIGVYIKSKAAVYPPQPVGRPMPGISAGTFNPKMARGFFAKLRSGEIQVPWHRGSSPGSQKLGARWRVEVRGEDVRVTNDALYGPLVQGAADQSLFHKQTGWKNEAQIADESKPEAKRILQRYYQAIIGRS